MKKMGWMLVCLMLALGFCTGALAQDEGVVVQSSCNIIQSGEYYLVYCFAQVHNNSEQIICLDEGALHISDGDQLLAAEPVSQLWPYFLAPGEDGFLFDIVSFEPGENGPVLPNITALTYQLTYMTIDPVYAGDQLETQARVDVDELGGEMYVVCEVTNTTDTDAYDPTIAFGLYTGAGQMVYTDGRNLTGVGIPAGGTVLVRFEVDKALADQWQSYGASPEHVRTNAMFRSNED